MTCEHCGAPLAPVAQFCGRCGRSVAVAAAPPAIVPPPTASTGTSAAPGPVAELLPCVVCGTRPHPDDRFCGECGASLSAPVAPEPAVPEPAVPEPVAAEPTTPEPALPALAPVGFGFSPLPREGGSEVTSAPADARQVPSPESAPEPVAARGGDAVPSPERRPVVLQFSTGDSVTVLGSGLLGRNPRPEPDEVVDHVVIVSDPTRSVSKTHLEFGFDGDAFWVSDRHSGNGTVVREPGQLPRYCEPGRRYHVARGTRVDMGDQFVIIG